MGLFKWLFGDSGPFESAATGALLGGAIGDRLQDANDRKAIIELLKLKIAQDQHYHEMEQIGRTLELSEAYHAEQIAKIEAWQWSWRMSGPRELLHVTFRQRMQGDAQFREKNRQLKARWWDLYERSLRVGIMPLHQISRSQFGDVAGTEKILTSAMDRLEEAVKEYEYLSDLERSVRQADGSYRRSNGTIWWDQIQEEGGRAGFVIGGKAFLTPMSFEATQEVRVPKEGEYFMSEDGGYPLQWSADCEEDMSIDSGRRPILRKVDGPVGNEQH